MNEPEVLAAGGVVVRDGERPQVAIVHRPKYDDWTLPKGKLEPGESFEAAALREVEEETGLRCSLGRYVGERTYRDRHGRLKLVRYWEMAPEGGEFAPNREVDELRWLTFSDAAAALSYELDRALLAKLG